VLTDAATIKSWADELSTLAPERDVELDRCASAASALIPRVAGITLETMTVTVRLNGSDAVGPSGNILELDHTHRNVRFSGMTITENGGAALTKTATYDATKAVSVEGSDSDNFVRLARQNGAWSAGRGNISVAYTFGYDGVEAAVPTVPADVVQLANEIALLIFRSKAWIGAAVITKEGFSKSYEKNLTPLAKMTLERLKAWGR